MVSASKRSGDGWPRLHLTALTAPQFSEWHSCRKHRPCFRRLRVGGAVVVSTKHEQQFVECKPMRTESTVMVQSNGIVNIIT